MKWHLLPFVQKDIDLPLVTYKYNSVCKCDRPSAVSPLFFMSVIAPHDVTQINVISRSETHLELQWTKVNNNNDYTYILRDRNGKETSITGPDGETTVTHTVSSLSAGTKYEFTLFTVFEVVRSRGYNFSAATGGCSLDHVHLTLWPQSLSLSGVEFESSLRKQNRVLSSYLSTKSLVCHLSSHSSFIFKNVCIFIHKVIFH